MKFIVKLMNLCEYKMYVESLIRLDCCSKVQAKEKKNKTSEKNKVWSQKFKNVSK